MDLTDQVREIMATTFGVDESELQGNVTQQTLSVWTSLAHVMLLLALEEHFGTSFSMEEMPEMVSVDKISSVLEERVAA